jgi:hypothetical protein
MKNLWDNNEINPNDYEPSIEEAERIKFKIYKDRIELFNKNIEFTTFFKEIEDHLFSIDKKST